MFENATPSATWRVTASGVTGQYFIEGYDLESGELFRYNNGGDHGR